ncbi:hypothetical protein DPMN_129731 [Dreissena polymorpha]|uniref:Uncharacterized protein n=1 Tax=Dreissena polymorpha TaxID=45954 RepID=A0A9D4H5F8_DREPO|nr:hypothetical protein DPMN_129731 [Dreissena polymorpha]
MGVACRTHQGASTYEVSSCRWKHFDLRANSKVLARRTADAGRRAGYEIPRVFSENSQAKNDIVIIDNKIQHKDAET